MKVLLGGEGKTELGGWANEPSYRNPRDRGVIESLLRRIRHDGWTVVDAIQWKHIRKFRASRGLHDPEHRNVLGLALEASERGIALLAFSRDRDRDDDREKSIEAALAEAADRFPDVKIIGGIAAEAVEGWLLALAGERDSETHARPKERLGPKPMAELLDMIEAARLEAIPPDACSLQLWLERARRALGA